MPTSAVNLNNIDLIIKARWIIPVVPANRVLENCAIAIDKGQILALLPHEEADRRYIARETVTLSSHVLIPGLVNAHGHAAMSLLRGYADDQPLHTWLNDHIWPAESRWVSEDFVRDGTELALAEMIKSGTTCFADMYFYPEQAAQACLDAQVRCQLAFPILDFPTAWGMGPDDYLNKGLSLHDNFRGNHLINIAFGPHAPYTVSDTPLHKIAVLAQEMDMPIHIHLHETAQEVSDSLAQYGRRPSQRMMDLGLLSPLTQCVHMTQIDETDIKLLQESGAHVIHCPESNLKLASGFCPVDKLLRGNINVALGTDGAASNNDLNLFSELKTAALLAKAVAGNAAALDAHSALRLATLNGAKALGMEDVIGSLEVGKSADITAVDLGDLAMQPVYNPASQLVYTHAGNAVTHVWVEGKVLLANRLLQTLNEREVLGKANWWRKQITAL
ncbi:N-ethylammeline chlorohydrolase [Cellvibrio mixtus]|uniref:5-methylthioadenosine/S-adenosylhomocysteine deaminase n=1 Tax=Cellvibrio mixtus TaxID=39650 RepID=A0A266Q542_9GAMM|nr:TRZ/ATZ family hydrolase [Cellvibrio mixtus]OZY84994.1 N-ethylammeline chlorohydrolase [Cellvibrio mixtus]